jgi:hypothetical protein
MWHRFLKMLRQDVDTAGRRPMPAESASALWHMATGEFWGDEAALMNPRDLEGARKNAAAYITRYGIIEPVAVDTEATQSIVIDPSGDVTAEVRLPDPEATVVINAGNIGLNGVVVEVQAQQRRDYGDSPTEAFALRVPAQRTGPAVGAEDPTVVMQAFPQY